MIFIALGYFLYFFTGYRTVVLGYAIGLMFADYFMFRRLGFLDQKTGFFKNAKREFSAIYSRDESAINALFLPNICLRFRRLRGILDV